MRYNILLVDADDTIFDFKVCESAAFRIAYSECGYEYSEKIYREYSEINLSFWKMLERGEIEKARLKVARFEKLFANHGITGDANALCKAYGKRLSEQHTLIDGAKDFLCAVKAACRIYIITNGITETQKQRFHDADIEKYIDGVFISEEIGHEKPKKEFFNAVFESIPNFDPTRAIVFGDSLTSDIKGAAAAGLDSCLFNPRGEANETGICPTYEVSSYNEFLKIIGV